MIKYDHTLHIGSIALSTNASKGIWSSQTETRLLRSTRTAGYVPAPVDSHELLAIGLNAALRSITKSQHKRLGLGSGVDKPSLLIVSADPSFLIAMNSTLANAPVIPPLRFDNARLIRELHEQAARFRFTYLPNHEEPTLTDLKDWANRHVMGGRLIEDYRASVFSTAA